MKSEWENMILDDVCSVTDCQHKTAPTVDYVTGYKMIRTANIRNGRFDIESMKNVTREIYEQWSARGYLELGDIILTREAPMGEVGIITDSKYKYFLGQRTLQLKPKENITSEFLFYSLQGNELQHQINMNEGTGSVVSNIRIPFLKRMVIKVPSIKIQKKITNILFSLDSKIELNNQMIATLEELAATLFKQWFVDFEFPDENGNPYKSSGGKLVDSELGEIPEGWEVNSIFDQCFITGGGTPKTNISDYWDGDIPFYTPKDAKNFLFVNNTEKHVSLSGLNNSSTRLYKSGTIFITARGTVGKINIAAKDMAMNQSCYAIISKNGNQYFFYNVLSRQVKLIKASSNGAVFNAITTRDFKLYKFSIPKNDELINLFEDRVNSFYEKCRNLILENDNLHEMRDSLLPKFLSGDILIK